jgi:hypothetical protein
MAEFWDFLIVAVIFWFVLRIVEMTALGPKHRRVLREIKTARAKKHMDFEEMEGFMVGGIICLFMGAAMYYVAPLILTPTWLSPLITAGGVILAAIGGALLVAYVVLSVIRRF